VLSSSYLPLGVPNELYLQAIKGVTDESAILAFINSLERGQLLRHRLFRERNEGKLTLNSMITIASNYAAADDDAH
jgi:hypothetical protein